MNINWARWILERLPFSLRVNRVYVLCLLFTQPVRLLHASFVAWSGKMRNRAGATAQVCMLKKVIFDELGISIEIEEGDGMPYDFIVKTSLADTDKEQQMLAMLNQHKMAGKSYLYINEMVSYGTTWEDFVCEVCEYSAVWGTSWVCEQKQKEVITIKVLPYYYGETGSLLKISASKALPRAVYITAVGYYGVPDWNITLPVGFTGLTEYSNDNFDLFTFRVSPYEDIDYIYEYVFK